MFACSSSHTGGEPVAEEAVQKWGGYLSYQDTFVWRKITFLWSDSKNWGGLAPLAPPIPPPMRGAMILLTSPEDMVIGQACSLSKRKPNSKPQYQVPKEIITYVCSSMFTVLCTSVLLLY